MSTALAFQSLDQSEWVIMRDMALVLIKTGFLPNAIKTPEQALAIMLKGRELNVPPMHALSQIVVIQGKPTTSAELMLALVYRDHGDNAIRVMKSDATICTVAYQRRAWEKAETFSFSMEDAKQAGLPGKDTWKNYPQAMLRARCISAVARMAFADSIGGMYTSEELGARVNADGRVVDGVEVATGEIVEPTPIRPRVALEQPERPVTVLNASAQPGVNKPADPLADLKDNWNYGAHLVRQCGVAVPELPEDATEASIRADRKVLQATLKIAKEAKMQDAYQAALAAGLVIDEDDLPPVGKPLDYYQEAAKLWRMMAAEAAEKNSAF